MEGNLKEVYFDVFCKTCKHKDVKEHKEPCCECLAEAANVDSHRPVKWEEKG